MEKIISSHCDPIMYIHMAPGAREKSQTLHLEDGDFKVSGIRNNFRRIAEEISNAGTDIRDYTTQSPRLYLSPPQGRVHSMETMRDRLEYYLYCGNVITEMLFDDSSHSNVDPAVFEGDMKCHGIRRIIGDCVRTIIDPKAPPKKAESGKKQIVKKPAARGVVAQRQPQEAAARRQPQEAAAPEIASWADMDENTRNAKFWEVMGKIQWIHPVDADAKARTIALLRSRVGDLNKAAFSAIYENVLGYWHHVFVEMHKVLPENNWRGFSSSIMPQGQATMAGYEMNPEIAAFLIATQEYTSLDDTIFKWLDT